MAYTITYQYPKSRITKEMLKEIVDNSNGYKIHEHKDLIEIFNPNPSLIMELNKKIPDIVPYIKHIRE